ncbi:MAG TPA: 50S ribosomal protein L15 [Anaerohalosphaeraceae bacterium]|jgi:large subunit ribosomal protein L15|nr:50S ribosomal protein L15 [Phycisphaerae bacterium]HOT71914.1 50S ribosomal protein L15 [Anaerohalosphaeraceae bacterium]HQG05284.1 50S ribosomal protein L15 [Anaerohalosphaeraceae bacterium]HQI07002.1 50S ribosomal protein L15 [Anaerohalosphaeraceae bacterium]HQJ66698.1 50S ribosomal protein L15 [Anaerohalosphaeraceae bacterium]
MQSDEITASVGANKKRKRVGRGRGSGHGKTAGRGHKGDRSRSGFSMHPAFEGGQMPLFRRLAKRGFSNARFSERYEIVNVSQLERYFQDGDSITITQMAGVGLIRSDQSRVKILGDGELTKKLTVSAHKFSKSAEQKISSCGGTAQVMA